jgi:PIN domain
MRHKSTATRLRARFSNITDRLANLVEALPVLDLNLRGGGVVYMGPQHYFGERSIDQQATQLALKREYEVISELLRLIVSDGHKQLVSGFQEGDKRFRDWLDLNGSWSVTPNKAANAKAVRAAAEQIEQILDVLDAAGKDEVILVPETNSLLSNADPTAYRGIAGQKAFVFMLLPTVLGELDTLKIEHRNPDVREKARKVIDRIKGWRKQGALVDGVTVDKTIKVKAASREPDLNKTLSWLDASNNDDRIIASVLAVQSESPSAHVVLVSGDINLLNKADVAMIETAETP